MTILRAIQNSLEQSDPSTLSALPCAEDPEVPQPFCDSAMCQNPPVKGSN